jgi:FAD/FMN-containing dehydrogenase
MNINLAKLSGNTMVIPGERLDALRARVRGTVLTKHDEGYAAARSVWNAMIDRRPAFIVRCAGAADVSAAVDFAREAGALLSVRGGGHNIAGSAVCDGAVMIDLSPMKSVRIDPFARTARVEPGVTLGEFDREAQAFGLVTPTGINSTTGIAGLTLGGGFGWTSRKFGLTADNLIGADVVTADGRLVHASDAENPDLFWAIRGGGGNFGIVVGFEFRLRPIEPLLMFCAAIYPEIRAAELLPQWRDFMTAAPEQVSGLAEFSTIPDDPEYPEAARGQRVLALAAVYDGSADEGEAVTSPLRSFGTPLLDLSARMPYRAIQSLYDPLFPKGRDRSYFRSLYLPSLDERAIGDIVAGLAARPSEMTFSSIWYFGDVVRRVAADATAFGDRSQPWLFSIDAIWSKREEDAANIAWVRRLWSTMRPYSNGRLYLNFLSANDDPNVMRDGVGRETYEKLAKVKTKYDPTNFFRLNQNIAPG